jgi:hypothetical protein
MAAKIAIMAITTSNSINVKARDLFPGLFKVEVLPNSYVAVGEHVVLLLIADTLTLSVEFNKSHVLGGMKTRL